MKKLIKLLVVLIVLAALGAFAFRFFAGPGEEAAGRIVLAAVEAKDIRTTISATGTLEPVDKVEVGTQVSGDIAKIYVDFNSEVKKGQVIAELDQSILKATLYQAEIALESAENDLKYKQSTYERTKKLAEGGSASAVDLESAEYEYHSARLSVERCKSEVSQAKQNLSYSIIKSPINGVVLERDVDVGQTVASSMSTPTLFVLAKDLTQMRVMADVDEADIGMVKKGQPVEFTVDAFLEITFNGEVQDVRLNPDTTSSVVTYTVVITAANPDKKLLPGMTATCTIVTESVKGVPAVPVKALKFTPSMASVASPPGGPGGKPPMPPDGEEEGGDSGEEGPPDMGPGGGPSGGPGGMGPGGGGGAAGGKAKAKKRRPRPQLEKGKVAWVSVDGMLRPQPVEIGLSDGVYTEIRMGLALGDSVAVSEEKITEVKASSDGEQSPFMPGPPGSKKKK